MYFIFQYQANINALLLTLTVNNTTIGSQAASAFLRHFQHNYVIDSIQIHYDALP